MLSAPPASEPMAENWIARHRDPVSFSLHAAGIPPTFLGTMLIPVYLGLMSWPIFGLALALFLGGYALQFLGHVWDWTEPGEISGARNWLRSAAAVRLRRASTAGAGVAVSSASRSHGGVV